MSQTLPKPSGFSPIGIYRKASDPIPHLRLLAFLKVIRDWETADIADDKKYYCIYSGNGPKKFATSIQTHPFLNKPPADHTPSGAYQITLETYQDLRDRYGFPDSFSPVAQDRMAVAIIESTAKNPLGEIRKGNLAAATSALKGRWSSLPGGRHTKGDLEKFIAAYNINFNSLIKAK